LLVLIPARIGRHLRGVCVDFSISVKPVEQLCPPSIRTDVFHGFLQQTSSVWIHARDFCNHASSLQQTRTVSNARVLDNFIFLGGEINSRDVTCKIISKSILNFRPGRTTIRKKKSKSQIENPRHANPSCRSETAGKACVCFFFRASSCCIHICFSISFADFFEALCASCAEH